MSGLFAAVRSPGDARSNRWSQLAVGPAGVRAAAGCGRGGARARRPAADLPTKRWLTRPVRRCARSTDGGENPYTVQHDLPDDARPVGIILDARRRWSRRWNGSSALKSGGDLSVEAPAVQPRWHLALPAEHAGVSECIARSAWIGESRGGHTRDDLPGDRLGVGRRRTYLHAGSRGSVALTRHRFPRCRRSSRDLRDVSYLRRALPGLARRRHGGDLQSFTVAVTRRGLSSTSSTGCRRPSR